MVRAVDSGKSLAEIFGCDDCYLGSCLCGRGGGIPALSYAIVANRAGIFNTRIDLSSEVWRCKDNVLTDSGDHVNLLRHCLSTARDRKSTRLNSSHVAVSSAAFRFQR